MKDFGLPAAPWGISQDAAQAGPMPFGEFGSSPFDGAQGEWSPWMGDPSTTLGAGFSGPDSGEEETELGEGVTVTDDAEGAGLPAQEE